MRVYIAGKMRNVKNFGFDKFDEAKARAEKLGFDAVSPADLDRAMGFDGMGKSGSDDEWETVMTKLDVIKRDMEQLWTCEAIALIPGWETSSGAITELAMAQFLGIQVLDAETFLPMKYAKVGALI